jgi:hypothetical protein
MKIDKWDQIYNQISFNKITSKYDFMPICDF